MVIVGNAKTVRIIIVRHLTAIATDIAKTTLQATTTNVSPNIRLDIMLGGTMRESVRVVKKSTAFVTTGNERSQRVQTLASTMVDIVFRDKKIGETVLILRPKVNIVVETLIVSMDTGVTTTDVHETGLDNVHGGIIHTIIAYITTVALLTTGGVIGRDALARLITTRKVDKQTCFTDNGNVWRETSLCTFFLRKHLRSECLDDCDHHDERNNTNNNH